MMSSVSVITAIVIVLLFVSCEQKSSSNGESSNTNEQQVITDHDSIYRGIDNGEEQIKNETSPQELVEELLIAAKNNDINRFLSLIPEYGIIVSIDNFIDTTRGDHLLKPNLDVNKPLFWGIPPSGDSIIMTFGEVFNTYVAKDFLAGTKSTQPECLSTVEFNASEIWQNISLYEYCLNPPSKKNDMLNWEAIRFIFSGDSLVAIVLDRWTP